MYKLVTNTAIYSGIISTLLFSPQLTLAQTIPNIQDIAQKTTVQINSDAHPGGSGVIVKKEGIIYTVLTANHVVCDRLGTTKIRCRQDFTYTIRTHDGREYPIKELQPIQKNVQDPDLALVTFESKENYQVASLGNSENLTIRADISVAGFPTIFGRVGKQRSFTITTQYNGTIWNSFSEKVGWRKGTWLSSNQLDFSLSAPKGQLPTLGVAELYGESFGLLPPVLKCRI
ncbi:trypsin-like peptidase domain-containing protein [Cylindrospermopsis raciborskii]|uniref:trypsin-like peptidase domain-containing protein n=1 Tax=Cylindrospermopsis raciborskii TaxID=77022 RepID=UPI0001C15DCA|nr:trypsin-like peptidase domain-containing protein [Cylindrospermopsis raciborskii]EFA68839.1 hypothetical protein CRC_02654 [Cylindrospermopsis raciborskii CS-505]